MHVLVFFCWQKTSYDVRISDCRSYVCSSDLVIRASRKRPLFFPLVYLRPKGTNSEQPFRLMVCLGKKRRGKPRRDDAGRPQIPRQGAEKGGRGKIGRCDRRLDAAHRATGWPIQQRPQKASGDPPARCVRRSEERRVRERVCQYV